MQSVDLPPITNPALRAWLTQQVKAHASIFSAEKDPTITPLTGDASFRRYYRLSAEHTALIVMETPDHEELVRFIRIADLFTQYQLTVPKLLVYNLEQGFVLLEDFGDQLLLNTLEKEPDSAAAYYRQAMSTLAQLQTIPSAQSNLPFYTQQLLEQELHYFSIWFLEQYRQYKPNKQDQEILRHSFSLLIESALEQPKTCVHRDFHARNLMLLPEDRIGVLDFQDAVIGPITYDLVSLLKDCYIRWPQYLVRDWVRQFYKEHAHQHCTETQFLRWFDWMGLQRHFKVLGIFARLHIRDQKSHYLCHLARIFDYIEETCQDYNELRPLLLVIQKIRML